MAAPHHLCNLTTAVESNWNAESNETKHQQWRENLKNRILHRHPSTTRRDRRHQRLNSLLRVWNPFSTNPTDSFPSWSADSQDAVTGDPIRTSLYNVNDFLSANNVTLQAPMITTTPSLTGADPFLPAPTSATTNFQIPEVSTTTSSARLLSQMLTMAPDHWRAMAAAAPASTTRATTPSARKQPLNNLTVDELQRQAVAVMHSMWASSTWNNRRHLIARFIEFRRARSLLLPQQLDWSVVLFCEETNTAPAGKLQYSKDLVAVHRRMELGTFPITRMYQQSLRAEGGLVPTSQAVPATPTQVLHLLRRAADIRGTRLAAAIFILWKTASRWDDVSRITKASFTFVAPTEIIISWAGRTKTTTSDPHRASTWTVIRHPQNMTWLVNIINTLHRDEHLITWTTGQFVRWLKASPTTATLTAHSFKRGALSFLLALFNNKVISSRHINLLPLLAKHKTIMDYPSITIRYLAESHETARMLGTQRLTYHIPCKWPPEQQQVPLPLPGNNDQEPEPPEVQTSDEDSSSNNSSSSSDSQDNIPLVRRFRMPLVRNTRTPPPQLRKAPPAVPAPPPARPAQRVPRRQRAQTLPPLPQQPLHQQLLLTTEMDGDSIHQRVEQRRMILTARGFPLFNNTGHDYFEGH